MPAKPLLLTICQFFAYLCSVMEKNADTYGRHYSKRAFGEKLRTSAVKAGSKVVYYALVAYYVLISGKTSVGDRIKIIGALGYFILPTDLVPDFLPGLGYTDDLAALAWCIYSIAKNITPEIKEKAQERLEKWFGKRSGMRGSNS